MYINVCPLGSLKVPNFNKNPLKIYELSNLIKLQNINTEFDFFYNHFLYGFKTDQYAGLEPRDSPIRTSSQQY